MDILKLGYTTKWIEYNFLTEEVLSNQNAEFEKDVDKKAEKYRYTSFVNWIKARDTFTNEEVSHYMELAIEDIDKRMSGSAITDLFVSPKLTNKQFEMIKIKLPEFGDWTQKVITREVLMRRINSERMSPGLFKLCYDYKVKFKDNRLLFNVIKKTNDSQCLALFEELEVGKKLKTLAKNKLKKLA